MSGAYALVGASLFGMLAIPSAAYVAWSMLSFAIWPPIPPPTPNAGKKAEVTKPRLFTAGFSCCSFMTVLLLAITAYFGYMARSDNTLFRYDPYEVLGLVEGDASDSAIKSAYRKLSLKNHPDKGGDPKKFQEISRAYKALTDAEAKKNMVQYGNPEGSWINGFDSSSFSMLTVDDKQQKKVLLAAYVAILLIVGPCLLWCCQGMTRHNLPANDKRPAAWQYEHHSSESTGDSAGEADDGGAGYPKSPRANAGRQQQRGGANNQEYQQDGPDNEDDAANGGNGDENGENGEGNGDDAGPDMDPHAIGVDGVRQRAAAAASALEQLQQRAQNDSGLKAGLPSGFDINSLSKDQRKELEKLVRKRGWDNITPKDIVRALRKGGK